MSGNWIEPLGRRVLLSAQLTGGTLVLTGTDSADDLAVMADPNFINVVDAKVNGAASYYSLASVTKIEIDALGGDDRITIDPAIDANTYYTSILGGAGNDRISGSVNNDAIDGGDGNDKIYGNAGPDSITGGSGNDTIYAGSGNDILSGGDGSDRVTGEGGNDVIDGGKGNNFIDAGDGNDVIKETVGSDTVFAGAGNDSGNFKGGGIVYGEAGSDTFVSTGAALLYGGKGNDNLQGASLWGDQGDDTLSGLNGADVIHGGDGNDLIRGVDGNDILIGDAGDDAIFGGGGTDTLYGGDGNDNLYGTDGAKDKHKDLAGADDGFGGAGSDWFETNYPWHKGDYQKGVDRPVASQNALTQDPSAGLYTSGTLTIRSNLGGGSYTSGISAGTVTFTGGTNIFNNGTITPPPITTNEQLGKIGWLSSGVSDGSGGFTPPPLTHAQRLAIRNGIVVLPVAPTVWQLGAITPAADNIVWYALSGVPSQDLAGTTWHFLAVKRGTVLITELSFYRNLSDPLVPAPNYVARPFGLDTPVLSVRTDADIRLAGSATVYHTVDSFDSLPTGGPAGAHGILLSDGVIWLPADGSAPYFDSSH